MRVFATACQGTIGGGALEWEAIRIARALLVKGEATHRQTFPLGPDLGQCCGGVVTLSFHRAAQEDHPEGHPFWIWGAGHVGRAIADVLAPLGDRDITLVDTSADRMPDVLPYGVSPLVAADPVRVVARAPEHADHIIVTYSHDIDLALCDALLRRDFRTCGLIGSATKWARFRKRLASMGHSEARISRIACPIGDPRLGKHPQAIAVGVVAGLLSPVAAVPGDDA